MKKIYFKMSLAIFVIGLFANNLFAQGAFVNFHAGYGFQMSSQNISYFSFYNQTTGNNSITNEQINVSFGKGINFGGAFGYMFNKNVGAELGVSYLIGGKTKARDISPNSITDYTLTSNMFRINPSLIIASGFEKLNPYAKFGLVVGFGSVKYGYTDNNDGDIEVRKRTLNGGAAIGLTSALGLMYDLSSKLSLFGELNMVNLSYAPTKGEYTEATYNGIDELPGMTTRERSSDFLNKYTYTNPPLDSQPKQELKEKLPFGSLGLNIGLCFKF
jgi:hypothetical protein